MRIYIHGNCQGPAIASLMREVLPDDITVLARPCFSISDDEMPAFRHDIETADAIACLPIGPAYRGMPELSWDSVRLSAKPSARVIDIPIVYHQGQLPQLFALGAYSCGVLSYHDAHAIDYFLAGRPPSEFIDDTGTTDFLPADFVISEAQRSHAELVAREDALFFGPRASDLIDLTRGQPLSTFNHPTRAVLAPFVERILSAFDLYRPVPLTGETFLDHIVIAPYRSTLASLGHDGQGVSCDRIRQDGCWMTRSAFYAQVFEAYAEIGPDTIKTVLIAEPQISEYLQRFTLAGGVRASADMRTP